MRGRVSESDRLLALARASLLTAYRYERKADEATDPFLSSVWVECVHRERWQAIAYFNRAIKLSDPQLSIPGVRK